MGPPDPDDSPAPLLTGAPLLCDALDTGALIVPEPPVSGGGGCGEVGVGVGEGWVGVGVGDGGEDEVGGGLVGGFEDPLGGGFVGPEDEGPPGVDGSDGPSDGFPLVDGSTGAPPPPLPLGTGRPDVPGPAGTPGSPGRVVEPCVGSSAGSPSWPSPSFADCSDLTLSGPPSFPDVAPSVTTVPSTATSSAPAPAATTLRRAPLSTPNRP
ncbi:MAG TPA: hypothetical protein VFH94_07970, partial [Streptomyces sp.]|nr:hypothetical protein [Streptomyces sp.]